MTDLLNLEKIEEADEEEMEGAAISDFGEDYLTKEEIKYYLSLKPLNS